jgi:tetratricopeptide (TPR) repeat protein
MSFYNFTTFKMFNRKLLTEYTFIYFILSCTLLVYAFSLKNEFNIDDGLYINNKYESQSFVQTVKDIFYNPTFTEIDGVRHEYRPVSSLVFYIEHRLFGYNPFSGHVTNLVLYMLLLWLIWHVLHFRLTNFSKKYLSISLLLFALHPLHTEVICSIKAREELLVVLFGGISLFYLYKYVEKSDWFKFTIIIFFFFLSMMSKKSGVLFLPILMAFHYLWTKNYKSRTTFFLYFGWLSITILYLLIHDSLESSERKLFIYENPLIGQSVSFFQNVATSLSIMGKYLVMQIFPYPLSCYYGFPVLSVVSFHSFYPWVSLLGLLLITITGLFLFLKKRILGTLVFCFLITILAVSNIIEPLPGMFAERFAFLPSFFSIPIIVVLVYQLNKNLKLSNQIISILFITIALFFGIYSFNRSLDWKNNKTLFEADVKSNPKNLKLMLDLGKIYSSESNDTTLNEEERTFKLTKARNCFYNSLLITPKDFYLQKTVAELDCLIGREKNCISSLNKGILKPPFGKYYQSLANHFESKKDTVKTILYLEKIIDSEPQSLKEYETLNRLYFLTHQDKKGIALLNRAIKLFPESPLGYAEMANYYLSKKDTLTALPYIEKAAVKPPKNLGVIQFLIDYYVKKKDSKKVVFYSNLKNT